MTSAKKKNPAAVALGKLGGKRRAEVLTFEQLSAIGKKANKASHAAKKRNKLAREVQ